MLSDTIRAWVENRQDELIHNLAIARNQTGKKIMCVIKGGAHGHGATTCGWLGNPFSDKFSEE